MAAWLEDGNSPFAVFWSRYLVK